MSTPEVPYQEIIRNLGTSSQAPARQALAELLQNQGDDAESLAVYIADQISELGSVSATVQGLGLLEAWRHLPPVLNLAVTLAAPIAGEEGTISAGVRDEKNKARVFAIGFLSQSNDSLAHRTIYSLVSDEVQDVRDTAIAAVPSLSQKASAAEATSLTVLKDEGEQKLALDLLDELEKAVHKLLDPAKLEAGQVEIIEELVLPRIEDLRGLLSTPIASIDEQRSTRKQSFGIGSKLLGTAKAIAYGVTGLAQADKAHQNVLAFVEKLEPLIDSIPDLLP